MTTDAAMIQQIVGNLIDNARKYARDAADKRIWVWAKPGVGSAVLLEVEDRGPGVPDAEKESVFGLFTRGSTGAHSPGVGVGLSLVAQFAALHGGRAWVEDNPGGGASFRVLLP